ncbi:hypothetical protein QQS21_011177 [Conoideocrella luteorostrata]|uniref:Uncharacterized protein n=1 Tax=Conoideocrella luteorostrata TaxID=1105319 RepID=A0AAJ0CGD0_9HYPO|nr:hypothetical protein QQS21_011177 [Conoideocrella luteorostrata]
MELAGPTNDITILDGCYLEAQRSDDISLKLEGLRIALNEPSNSHLALTISEIRSGAHLLRHLADVAQVHRDRVQFVLNPLNAVLPCLSRSLRDIQDCYDDRSRSKQNRWRQMYHSLTKEAGGLPLTSIFILYTKYISLLRDILTRSPNFDLASMDYLSLEITRLREARGFGPPSMVQAGLLVRHTGYMYGIDPITHWAEHIFTFPPPSKTSLGNVGKTKALGPHRELGHHNIPMNSKVLFRQSFDHDQLSLTVFNNPRNSCAYILIRIFKDDRPWFSLQGAHELCIERSGSSLQLRRWSKTENCSKPWAILFFLTWEELVLMYCTFISLKARNNLTLQFRSDELELRGEKKLFQACIRDDGFNHSLIVYEDRATRGLRLHAAVWDGELRQCPVWTAFVSRQATSMTWLVRVSQHKVRLADIQLFIFCKQYREQSQRRGRSNAFQIEFMSYDAAQHFEDVFYRRGR